MFAALANMHVPQAVSRPEKPLVALDVRAQQDKLSRSFALSAEHGFLARFVVLNLIGAALVAAAWAEDLLAKPYQADTSGMCWLITALFGWGQAQSFESFKQVVTAIYIGAGTALYTNLLACIGYLWLGTNAHLLARQEV